MKFLIDENLPPALVEVFRRSGFTALHINEFGNAHPISDNAIRHHALHDNWVVVTKDDDFVSSFVSKKVPEKVIYVYNLYGRHMILDTFTSQFHQIISLINQNALIEINPEGIKPHF